MNKRNHIGIPIYTIVLYGDNMVGTTSLIRRYVYNTFDSYFYSTLTDYYVKVVVLDNGKEVKIRFLDIYNYRGLYNKWYFKRADGVMLTYDKTLRRSFENIESKLSEMGEDINPNTLISLVGCKEDLYLEEQISREEGENFANEIGLLFYETSAKENSNVNECFNDFINRIVQINPKENNNIINIKRVRPPKRGCLK